MIWDLTAARIINRHFAHTLSEDELNKLLREHRATALAVDTADLDEKDKKNAELAPNTIFAFLVYLDKYCLALKKMNSTLMTNLPKAWLHKMVISAWLAALKAEDDLKIYNEDWLYDSSTYWPIILSQFELPGNPARPSSSPQDRAISILALWESEFLNALDWRLRIKDDDLVFVLLAGDQEEIALAYENYLNLPLTFPDEASQLYLQKLPTKKTLSEPLVRKRKAENSEEDGSLSLRSKDDLDKPSSPPFIDKRKSNRKWMEINQQCVLDHFSELLKTPINNPNFLIFKREVLNLLSSDPKAPKALLAANTIFSVLENETLEKNTKSVQEELAKLRGVLNDFPPSIYSKYVISLLGDKNSVAEIKLIREVTKQSQESVENDINKLTQIEFLNKQIKSLEVKRARAKNNFMNVKNSVTENEITNLKKRIIEREIAILTMEESIKPDPQITEKIEKYNVQLDELKMKEEPKIDIEQPSVMRVP